MRATDRGCALFVEIRQGSFHAVRSADSTSGDLARTSSGQLTEDSRKQLIDSLRQLVPSAAVRDATLCYCAIPGSGVLLHTVRLPTATREETARLLQLRVESEFPLAPNEMAWGFIRGEPAADGSRNFTIAAVRKEVVAEYVELFRQANLSPMVTISALARVALLPEVPATGALLDIGPHDSELVVIEEKQAVSIRGFSRGAASQNGFGWHEVARREPLPGRLFVTGNPSNSQPTETTSSFGAQTYEELKFGAGPGITAAIAGLRRLTSASQEDRILRLSEAPSVPALARTASWPWPTVALAAVLLLGLLVAPYAEAIVRTPGLQRRVASVKSQSKSLAIIDREFGFLRHLEASQPPYLEALYLLANSAAPGTRIESTTLNRRGEIALRGKTQNMAQIGDLRSKLMATGFFSSVVVEDQLQGPDRQSVQFRLSARWKSPEERESLVLGPDLSTNKPAASPTNPPTPRK